MNPIQKQVYENIAAVAGLRTSAESIAVAQTPTYLKEPMKVADFAVGVVSALGAMAAELGESRGLPPQSIDVDRRHAALSFNNAGFHFINGTLIIGGEIMVPVNGFYETKDKRWMCFNGAYPHLRDGILQYFDAPHTQEALIHQVAKHESAKIESDFEALGLCAAPVMSPEEWLAHPQGKVMASQPIILTKQYGDAKQRQLSDASHRPLEAYG